MRKRGQMWNVSLTWVLRQSVSLSDCVNIHMSRGERGLLSHCLGENEVVCDSAQNKKPGGCYECLQYILIIRDHPCLWVWYSSWLQGRCTADDRVFPTVFLYCLGLGVVVQKIHFQMETCEVVLLFYSCCWSTSVLQTVYRWGQHLCFIWPKSICSWLLCLWSKSWDIVLSVNVGQSLCNTSTG